LRLISDLGLSSSKTAASFIRPSRVSDPSQSFVEAVHQKYSTEHLPSSSGASDDTIHVISGKVVEEVGFDKIRHQLAQLQDLKIVIVDGARINEAETKKFKIRDVCPKIVEIDLSRNLFESFQDVVDICGELDGLRSLRVKYVLLQKRQGAAVTDLSKVEIDLPKLLSKIRLKHGES